MFRTLILLAIITLLSAAYVNAQDIPAPKRKPVPTTEAQRDLMREAVALHDKGDYDGAISKYKQVLAENPDDTAALYEMSFSLFAKGDYKASLENATKGAGYDSPQLSSFYVLIGNNFDQLGQHDKAIKVYQSGIKQFPNEGQLRYNLAIAYISLGKPEDAKKSLKESARIDPTHPSSHLGLGQMYEQGGYKIPALMAFARFLVLEPNSRRSGAALQKLQSLMQSGVSQGADQKINIVINTSEKKDEGDFSSMTFTLSLLSATRHLDKNKDKTEMQLNVDAFDSFFAILSESTGDKKSSGFAWNYYRPYFIEMKRRNLVEPFCYVVFYSSSSPEVKQWVKANQERVDQFLVWSRGYSWPKNL